LNWDGQHQALCECFLCPKHSQYRRKIVVHQYLPTLRVKGLY
jgi:hypothetical protein